MPASLKSSVYRACPVRNLGSSTWRTRAPTNRRTPRSAVPAIAPPDRLRRRHHGVDDELVARAATDVAGHALAHLLARRPRIAAQEVLNGQDHAWGAEAALLALVIPKRLLDRMQVPTRRRHALDRLDRPAVGLDCEHDARANRLPVNLHGARTTDAVLAPEVRARKVEIFPQEVAQTSPDVNLAHVGRAIHLDAHGPPRARALVHPVILPSHRVARPPPPRRSAARAARAHRSSRACSRRKRACPWPGPLPRQPL